MHINIFVFTTGFTSKCISPVYRRGFSLTEIKMKVKRGIFLPRWRNSSLLQNSVDTTHRCIFLGLRLYNRQCEKPASSLGILWILNVLFKYVCLAWFGCWGMFRQKPNRLVFWHCSTVSWSGITGDVNLNP